jgi:hypothetical protein
MSRPREPIASPQDADRGAHPADQVVVGLGRGLLGDVDDDPAAATAVAGALVLDVAAEPAQDLAHDLHVEDVGDLVDGGRTRRQQGGRHELERAVLRTRDPHPTGQGRAAAHLEALHRPTLRGPLAAPARDRRSGS